MAASSEAAAIVAEHAAKLRFEDLPREVVVKAKQSILDTLAVAVAGSGTKDAEAVVNVVESWGGAPQSTVVGLADRLPSVGAVFANAAMVHQYDFDDTHDTAVCHPTSASLFIALALAEARAPVSGKRLVTAVAAGNDLVARLGLAINGTLWDFPWVRAPVVGIFGAALAGGMIVGLSAEQLWNALGFALPQAAGTLECLQGESAVRGLRDGLIYRDAVVAVLLAEAGLAGDREVFDGKFGLFQAYFDGRYDRSRLLEGLGQRYETLNVSLKPWPSCRHTHATLTALFNAMRDRRFATSDVARVTVRHGDGNRHLTVTPSESATRMELLCNLPFAVAVALTYGRVPVSAFLPGGARDGRIREAMRKIRFEYDPRQNRNGTIEPGAVEVLLRDGSIVESVADQALGHPVHPMDDAQLAQKVHLAVEAGRPGINSHETAVRLIEVCSRLEDIADVREVAAAVAADARSR